MSGSIDWNQMVELASDGFWLLDKEFMTVYVNPSLEKILGYSKEEMIGRSWYDFGDPEWVARAKELEKRRVSGIKEPHKFLFVHKNGRQVLTRIATTPLYDDKGNFDGAIGVLSDISNEKETEDALKSKGMLSSITKAASVGMSLINRDYTIEWYNDLHAQWFGPLEKAKGRNCYDIFEGRDTICPDCPTKVTFETRDVAFVEHCGNPELIGVGRIFSLTTSPIRDASNNVIQVVEIAQDITERKRSEAVLLARLRLQKFAVSHSLDELLRATLDEAEALTGSRIGFYHFVDSDQLNLTLQAWSTNTAQICKAEGSGSHYPVEQAGVWVDCLRERRAVIHNDYASLPHRKGLPEGHTQVMRELVVPVLRDDAIVAILGVGNKPIDYRERDIETITSLADFAWDIVQSKQAEEKLRESEEKYRAIVDSIDGDMYICAKDYRIEFMNDRLIRQIGRNATGEYCYKALYDFETVCEWCVADQVFTGKSVRWELKNPKNARWCEVHNSPLRNGDGTISRQTIITDITEMKSTMEQLVHSQKMESIGQLAGGLAHDFNNMLSVINGYCCLMNMDVGQNKQLTEYVDKIQKATGRAGDLSHSLLAFSRTQVLNPKYQNLNMIIFNVGTFVKRIIGEDIHFGTVTNDSALPVYVDAGQIEQVLINLCTNARDAMPGGGGLTITTDHVQIDAQFISSHDFGEPGKYAVITVSDTGTGIDEAHRKKIFEPFFTTKDVGKGTGLGLAMVFGIIKQHNGFVDVTSEPGKGTSFQIYLPIVESAVVEHIEKNAAGIETSTGIETILVVEDDNELRESLRLILSKLGYRVITAIDGQDGVEKFRDNAEIIKLVIMDMIMPRKSGKLAYDEIRQIKPDARALFSSGYSAQIIRQQGELGKNADFIPKPVQPVELLQKVREILDRS